MICIKEVQKYLRVFFLFYHSPENSVTWFMQWAGQPVFMGGYIYLAFICKAGLNAFALLWHTWGRALTNHLQRGWLQMGRKVTFAKSCIVQESGTSPFCPIVWEGSDTMCLLGFICQWIQRSIWRRATRGEIWGEQAGSSGLWTRFCLWTLVTGVRGISDRRRSRCDWIREVYLLDGVTLGKRLDPVNCGLSAKCHHLSFKRHNDIGNFQMTIPDMSCITLKVNLVIKCHHYFCKYKMQYNVRIPSERLNFIFW